MNEEQGTETNCTAEYGQSFEKQSRSIKWPCLKWKLGCFILSKTHSYWKKKIIPAWVIVTTYWCISEERADWLRNWQFRRFSWFYNVMYSFWYSKLFSVSLSVYLRKKLSLESVLFWSFWIIAIETFRVTKICQKIVYIWTVFSKYFLNQYRYSRNQGIVGNLVERQIFLKS